MRTLTAALRHTGDAGHALPTVIPQLGQLGAHLRLGELSMFASASGVGKSVVALHIAMQLKLPVLYISADTSAATMAARAASMITGDQQHTVLGIMDQEPTFYDEQIKEATSHILWDYNTNPSIEDIRKEIDSFAALIGDYPSMIVVDNVRNIYSEEDDTHAQQHACENLKTLAAGTGSAVLALHHVTGTYADGLLTPPQSALENKLDKFPALILSFSYGNMGDLRVAVLKNRYGASSASGRLKAFIPIDLSRMRIGHPGA